MKRLLIATATAVTLLATSGAATADWTPKGPITMQIAFKAGGGADTQARGFAAEMEKRYGWKVIPKQVTGKGGVVLASKLNKEPNDGTVIGMLVTESVGYNMVSSKNAGYSLKDITPIATTGAFQMGVIAKTEMGWKSMDDVFKAMKGGKKIRFGVMSPKLADLAYMLGKNNGVDFNIVSFKGGKGVMNALNAGDADIGFSAGIQAKGVKAGTLVNLASALKTRLAMSPDAKTFAEYGVPFSADGYFLYVAPAGIPADARAALAKAITEIANDPTNKAGGFIAKALGGPTVITGAELDKLLQDGVDNSGALMKAAAE